MRSNREMKIEFKTKYQATKFLNSSDTNIGGSLLRLEHKEREVNPTVSQCWVCGLLNQNHSSEECNSTQRCLKCGKTNHKFYNCFIARRTEDMTDEQREARYCIPCDTQGSHTSMDHTACPKKREIIRERARVVRLKRNEDLANKKDTELINILEYTDTKEWPNIQSKTQTKVCTLITLALLDEAVNPGVFQNKLTDSCEKMVYQW